jgi:ribosomal protein L37AE/L43A
MKQAIWRICPGVTNDGRFAHSMRDYCTSCAPYWEQYPTCPDCKRKLTRATASGRVKCKHCGQFVKVGPEPVLVLAEAAQK